MAVKLNSIDIIAFDLHTALMPALAPATFHPLLTFVSDAASYNTTYAAGKSVVSKDLTLAPLSFRTRSRNHFWRNYAGGASADFWNLQVPFVARYPNAAIELLSLPPNVTGYRVSARTFLSMIGWSTSFEIRLQGDFDMSDIQTYAKVLKDSTHQPLRIDHASMSLAQGFSFFSARVREALYAGTPPTDQLTISRYILMSITKTDSISSALLPFRADVSHKRMNDSDRAEVIGVLLGQSVQISDLKLLEQNGRLMVTGFGGPDFALTDFRQSTLLYLQKKATNSAVKFKSLWCLLCNIRSMLMMTYGLDSFWSATKKSNQQSIKDLRASVETNLGLFPQKYRNALASSLFQTDSTLMRWKS